MPQITRRALTAGLACAAVTCTTPGFAAARPTRYVLDPNRSTVAFSYRLNGTPSSGTMPVTRADIVVDPENLSASQVDVSVSVARARTGLVFVTQALKSAEVLDAARFPEVRFVSESVALAANGRLSDGATITGRVTLRGVTRRLSFRANVYRQPGSAANDLENLTVQLTGAISRSAFGASGFANYVDDEVTLDIQAAIRAA
ncbi:MAG: YceI family protein [Pseudomonadota bacterium]